MNLKLYVPGSTSRVISRRLVSGFSCRSSSVCHPMSSPATCSNRHAQSWHHAHHHSLLRDIMRTRACKAATSCGWPHNTRYTTCRASEPEAMLPMPHLEGLCCAPPPDADRQLARPAVCQHVSSGCADGLHTGAAAPLACQGIVRIIQLPGPQPVHVGQGCGGGTAQACTSHTNTHCGDVKHSSQPRPEPLGKLPLARHMAVCYLGCKLHLHRHAFMHTAVHAAHHSAGVSVVLLTKAQHNTSTQQQCDIPPAVQWM